MKLADTMLILVLKALCSKNGKIKRKLADATMILLIFPFGPITIGILKQESASYLLIFSWFFHFWKCPGIQNLTCEWWLMISRWPKFHVSMVIDRVRASKISGISCSYFVFSMDIVHKYIRIILQIIILQVHTLANNIGPYNILWKCEY